jgi:hypothetical protein
VGKFVGKDVPTKHVSSLHRPDFLQYSAEIAAEDSFDVDVVQGLSHPTPFHGYAALITGGVVAAVLASRFRSKIGAWRPWHGALMSLSLLGAVTAIGGVIGGLALGVGRGPVYYRMFNGVIVIFTGIGLWIINTRPVIWGRQPTPEHRKVRLWFTAAAITMSGALVLAQWIFSR